MQNLDYLFKLKMALFELKGKQITFLKKFGRWFFKQIKCINKQMGVRGIGVANG